MLSSRDNEDDLDQLSVLVVNRLWSWVFASAALGYHGRAIPLYMKPIALIRIRQPTWREWCEFQSYL